MSARSELTTFFNERITEINEYLDLLKAIEDAAASGIPRLERSRKTITAAQQKILYSSVYLQLYNLVEAIVTRCLDAVTGTFAQSQWRPADLNDELREEWVKYTAQTHIDMTPENRLKNAMAMCQHLLDSLPLAGFKIEKGGGGNWDDDSIYKLGTRLGCKLTIKQATNAAIKRPIRDGLGAMKLVKTRRNSLAHGSISFTDCADGVDVGELLAVANAVENYLREIIECFSNFIDVSEFLTVDKRPKVSSGT